MRRIKNTHKTVCSKCDKEFEVRTSGKSKSKNKDKSPICNECFYDSM